MKKLPTLKQIRQWMTRIAKQNGIVRQVGNTWRHSTVVWRFAYKIAGLAIKNGYQVDLKFLKIACYSHDIGRMMSGGAKSSKALELVIFHFYDGYHLMKKFGYSKLARVCIFHAGGSGLDKKTNQKYGFIPRDFFPRTIEEKIIAYADSRADYKESKGPFINSFKFSYNRFKKYPGVAKRLKQNYQFIKKITNHKIK